VDFDQRIIMMVTMIRGLIRSCFYRFMIFVILGRELFLAVAGGPVIIELGASYATSEGRSTNITF